MADIETQYYLRINVADHPGVLARISTVFGDHLISISSVLQKEVDEETQMAEVVIMTHPAREKAMQQTMQKLEQLDVVKEISNFIRVETG
jgi:homoserine dehydrogenase